MFVDVTERKRAEEALAAERLLLRAIIDIMPALVYVKDTASRKILANSVDLDYMGGLTEAEALGKTDFDFYPQEMAARFYAREQTIMQTGQPLINNEHDFIRGDGQERWLLTSKVPLRNNAGQVIGLVGTSLDITERKQAAEALAAERSLLRTLIDHLPDAVYVKDAAGRKTLSSPGDLRNIGAAAEAEVLGKTDFDLFPRDLAEKYYADDQYVIQSGQPILNREEEITRADGTRGWQLTSKMPIRDSAGQVTGLVGIGHDITDRRHTEKALLESEERFRSLYENSTIGLYRTTPDGRILLANPALVKLLGYASFEALTARDLSKNGYGPTYSRAQFLEIIERDGEIRDLESSWTRQDGKAIFIRESARAIRDPQGKTLYYDGTIEDITARKQAEAEIHRNAEQLATTIDVQHSLAATLDQHAIWANLGQGVRQLFPDVSTIFISSYDSERAMISAVYGLQDGEPVDLSTLPVIPLSPPGRGTQSQVIHTRQPLVIAAGLKEKVSRGNIVVRVGENEEDTQSALYVPMLIQEQVLGVIQLQSYTPDRFREADVKLLSLVANTAAVSLQNARLYELAQNEIVERKRVEIALRESEARAQAMLRAVPDLVFRLDRNGVFLDYRADTNDLYDQSGPTLIGKHSRDVLPPELADLIDRQIRVTLETGVLQTFEYRLPIPDKGMRAYEARMAMSGTNEVTAIVRDITERKEAERKLQESETMLRLIFENAFDGISIQQELPGQGMRRLINCNERYAEMAGRSKQALLEIGNTSSIQKNIEPQRDTEENIRLRLERKSYRGIFSWLRPDNKENVIEYTAAPTQMGDLAVTIGIDRDITERIETERKLQAYTDHLEVLVAERTRALEEAQERLLRQERLTVLGQIAGGIAHELRTPLGAIKNSIYLLNLLTESPDATVQEALAIMNQEISTSDRIISSLLNFTRPQRPARQIVNVNQVIEQALARVDVPPQIEIRRLMDGELPRALVDAGQVEQVFGNLILNATQAMPQGGQLTIQTRQVQTLPENAETGFMPTGEENTAGWLVVSVSDSGTGISPEHLAQLFQPLFTTKAKGMGLGLALVKLLTEANGGGMAVESTLGQGTTFHTYWPVSASGASLAPTYR
jgi:PAS domain S-box-containing protein